MTGYRKRWWLISVLLGGIAGFLAFMFHGWLITGGGALTADAYLTRDVAIVFGMTTVLSIFFVPVYLASDRVSKRSNMALAFSALLGAIALATLVLLWRRVSVGQLITRGWNAYLYAFAMGLASAVGWWRSRSR